MLPFASWPLGATLPDSARRKPSEIPSQTRSVSAFSVGPRSFGQFRLQPYVVVTEKPGMLKPDTIALAKLTKGFRNLIHPGHVQHLGESCDRSKALTAVGGMVRVVRDVTP